MAIQEFEVASSTHLTLYYNFKGYNNKKNVDMYRSENPWLKMTKLRDALASTTSVERVKLGVVFVDSPDDSVWRLNLLGDVTPATLDVAARKILQEIESLIYEPWPGDDVRVITGHRTGVFREWRLVPD